MDCHGGVSLLTGRWIVYAGQVGVAVSARDDMKVLAHIREQYGLSLGSAVYPERPPCGQSKGAVLA